MIRIRFGPEEGQEFVPAPKAAWEGGGEVDQQRESIGLRDDLARVLGARTGKLRRPEDA